MSQDAGLHARDQLRIDLCSDGADVWITVEGEIDVVTSPKLRGAVLAALAAHPRTLHLTMAGITFIDSSGLSVIAYAHKHAALSGACLTLHQPTRSVQRVLDLAGFSGHITIV